MINLIKIPRVFDDCYLYFVQRGNHIPFTIKRIYYITHANPNLSRGHHAHKITRQVLFCIQGSVKITLDDGKIRQSMILDQSDKGVYIDTMIWHEMTNFKKDTILLALASRIFNEKDYIRDYEQFKKKADKIR